MNHCTIAAIVLRGRLRSTGKTLAVWCLSVESKRCNRSLVGWFASFFNLLRSRCALALAHNCFTVFSTSSVSITSPGYS
jgi:hypothetical protein